MNSNIKKDTDFNDIDSLNWVAWNKRISDSTRAEELSLQAINESKTHHYNRGLAEGLRTYGFCLIRLSKHKEAEACLREALKLFTLLKNKEAIAPVYEFLGIIERSWGNFAASLENINKAIVLSQEACNNENQTTHFYQLGVTYRSMGNYEKALDNLFTSLSLAQNSQFSLMEGYAINVIGSVYFENEEYDSALQYFKQGLVLRRKAGDKWGEAGSLDNIGATYLRKGLWEEAIHYCQEGFYINHSTGDKKGQANTLLHLAEIYKQKGDLKMAMEYCQQGLQIRQSVGDRKGEAEALLIMGELWSKEVQGQVDTPELPFLLGALKIAEEIHTTDLLSKAHYSLYESYKRLNDHERSLKQLELHITLEKQLHKDAINQKIANLNISHKAEEAKKEAEIFRLRNVELADMYAKIKEQKEEIERRKTELESALSTLQATQRQLIQSEKMASLGELTAGIAHEIQNPLNFVNNFSEINVDLLNELKDEADNGNLAEVKALADDLMANEQKIVHHGKRADAIVKGMLQHSRSSTGQKEPTDINALCDEYLRLAYHGMKAKDKAFNASIKTDFDEHVGALNIITQDIGRVVLNLVNNALYAVDEKKKQLGDGYEPTVSITTKKNGNTAEIMVKDNGNGIPDLIKEKIFQPFFTTKPTGEGTGLGLSLSYDMVKAHGGEIQVNTEENRGTEFTIQLPIQ